MNVGDLFEGYGNLKYSSCTWPLSLDKNQGFSGENLLTKLLRNWNLNLNWKGSREDISKMLQSSEFRQEI